MKALALGLGGLALALLSLAPPTLGQYMYLDSNGDGVHTAADQIHAVGPTVIDIWFDIGHNRDGSVAVCNADPGTVLDMFSYVANLEASDGTMAYSAFTNRLTQVGLISPPPASDETRFSTGYYAAPLGRVLGPGKYLLGTLTVNVISGTPSVQIVAYLDSPPSFEQTGFGTDCAASEFPNTYALGYDWFDVDGLAYGTGGGPNQAPTVSPPVDMDVPAGENATQNITASDPEGQPLTFAKTSGPLFMFVATTDKGAGTAHGEIRLAPFVSDIGTSVGNISVSDGTASDQKSLGITVSAAPNHSPQLISVPKVMMAAGSVRRSLLSAGDADGGTLRIAKAGGPNWVIVQDLAARSGGASASLTASPALCDIGVTTAAISVTDGMSEELREFELTVLAPSPPPDSPPLRFADPGMGSAVALGDLNGDGDLDVVATHEDRATISVFLGHGDGDLAPPTFYTVGGRSMALAVVDLDRNGHQDIAVANPAGVSVLLGKGDGTFSPATEFATGSGPSGIVAADVNRDGAQDLVTSNRAAGSVSVLLGVGDGTFAGKRDALSGIQPTSLVVGDMNLDGRLDVVVSNAAPGSLASLLTVLIGLGDGTFRDPLPIPVAGFPTSLTSGDWNWDGAIDLAVMDFYNLEMRTYAGRGDGSFAQPTKVATLGFPLGTAAEDLDGDGNMDLVIADPIYGRLAFLPGDGVGGFGGTVFLATAAVSAPRAVAIGDLNSDARPDVVAAADIGAIYVLLNRDGPTGVADTRAFVLSGHRAIPSVASGGQVCIRVEPVGDSPELDGLDLPSIVLRSDDTGSMSEIRAISGKSVTGGDTDQNGIPEIGVCFAKRDLAALFDQVRGRSEVTAHLSGSLTDRRVFCTSVELNVLGMGEPPHASFAPNPLNPESKLAFVTARDGPVKARIFDIQGRLVRTLLDTERLPAGEHEFSFDGKGDRGTALPSGVFYYRVESTDGVFGGRIVILK